MHENNGLIIKLTHLDVGQAPAVLSFPHTQKPNVTASCVWTLLTGLLDAHVLVAEIWRKQNRLQLWDKVR